MAQRKGGASSTKPSVASKRKPVVTDKAKAAGRANLEKGRKAREKAIAEARESGQQSAGERWAALLDGSLSVTELDDEELARMTVRGADGGFAGRRRAVPSHLAQAMQKEAIKRATEMFRHAAPKAVKRLLEIADDPDTKDADAIRALDIVLNRGLGKMPETILVDERSKWDEALDDSLRGGVDRSLADDE